MKKFLLVAFFLLFGFTTTTSLANDDAAPVDSAVAASTINTLEWSIDGGSAYIVIAGGKFFANGGGSISASGLTVSNVDVEAAEGYELLSKSVSIDGNKIVVYATVRILEQ